MINAFLNDKALWKTTAHQSVVWIRNRKRLEFQFGYRSLVFEFCSVYPRLGSLPFLTSPSCKNTKRVSVHYITGSPENKVKIFTIPLCDLFPLLIMFQKKRVRNWTYMTLTLSCGPWAIPVTVPCSVFLTHPTRPRDLAFFFVNFVTH